MLTRTSARHLTWQAFSVVSQWMRVARRELLVRIGDADVASRARADILYDEFSSILNRMNALGSMIGDRTHQWWVLAQRRLMYDFNMQRHQLLGQASIDDELNLVSTRPERQERVGILTALVARQPKRQRR